MKILVTGFEPFDGAKLNASWEAVRLLPERVSGADVLTLQLSTAFDTCFAEVKTALVRENPDVVLCLGEAGGRTCLTPERVAINLDDARIADNRGAQPVDQAILADAPAAYFTRLPVKNLVAAMVATGVPAAVSYSAGTFVCNHLMFRLEHLCATERPDLVTGFLHVPVLEAMELPTTLRGLIAVLKLLASRTSTGW